MYNFYITFVVPPTVLIPIVIAFLNYPWLSNAFKIILAFVVFSALINLLNIILADVYHMRTLYLFHIYTIFEFAFLSAYFAEVFAKQYKKIIWGIALLFVAFCLFNSLFIQKAMMLNSYARSVDAIIIVIYCLLYFFETSGVDEEENSWSHKTTNWLTAGILVYYASSMFMFIFSNYLLTNTPFTQAIWATHDTFLILEYILFAVGFYKCRSQQTISTY